MVVLTVEPTVVKRAAPKAATRVARWVGHLVDVWVARRAEN